MAAPVVSGTVALMLQANPNADAEPGQGDPAVHGAAVPGLQRAAAGRRLPELARRGPPGQFYARQHASARGCRCRRCGASRFIWGNHRITGGYLNPQGERLGRPASSGARRTRARRRQHHLGHRCAARATTSSGAPTTPTATTSSGARSSATTTSSGAPRSRRRQHHLGHRRCDDNIIWGTDCGGADCDNIIWGTSDADNIIWGTADQGDNIVWGTTDRDNIVWGTSSDDDDSWGSSGDDEVFPDNDTEPACAGPAAEFATTWLRGALVMEKMPFPSELGRARPSRRRPLARRSGRATGAAAAGAAASR